jgi:hypothetical protein
MAAWIKAVPARELASSRREVGKPLAVPAATAGSKRARCSVADVFNQAGSTSLDFVRPAHPARISGRSSCDEIDDDDEEEEEDDEDDDGWPLGRNPPVDAPVQT